MIKRISISVASARGVADRWRASYYDKRGQWGNTVSGSSEIVYDKLCALGPNPDIAKVAEIIGNKSWSYLTCSGCGEYVVTAVSFGHDYENCEVLLCEQCIKDATTALEISKGNP